MEHVNGIWHTNHKRRYVLRIGFPLDSHVEYDSNGTPVYDRAITSAPLRKLIKCLFSDGVLPNPSTNLQVSAGNGMNVLVQPGFALCNGCLKLEETQRTLAIQASNVTYDRIDTVVVRLNDNDSERICDLYIVEGIPATNPVRPTLRRDASVFELGLADLFIVKNSTAISNQRITDTRYETSRCGIISSISEFDSDKIYKQIQADLAGFKAEEQAGFVAWFEEMRGQLSEDAAGNLQVQIDNLKKSDTKDNTISFANSDVAEPTGFENVALLKSGERHALLLHKVSQMFKNIRRLIKLVGATDISALADGTLTGSVSELDKKITEYINANIVWNIEVNRTDIKVVCCNNTAYLTGFFEPKINVSGSWTNPIATFDVSSKVVMYQTIQNVDFAVSGNKFLAISSLTAGKTYAYFSLAFPIEKKENNT